MKPETLEDVLTRLESAVEKINADTRPAVVRTCLQDVVVALRMLAANNPSGVLASTEE